VPTLLHLSSDHKPDGFPTATAHTYPVSSPYFALPQVVGYDPGSAALAHSRSLVFLRKQLGGPVFDLEAIWDEHCFFEFQDRSVAKTMGTMVVRSKSPPFISSYNCAQAEPYVNHVPTVSPWKEIGGPIEKPTFHLSDDWWHRTQKSDLILPRPFYLFVSEPLLYPITIAFYSSLETLRMQKCSLFRVQWDLTALLVSFVSGS
jgi:hypothetical protein